METHMYYNSKSNFKLNMWLMNALRYIYEHMDINFFFIFFIFLENKSHYI